MGRCIGEPCHVVRITTRATTRLQVAALRNARAAKASAAAAKAAAARTASLEREFESAFNGFAADGKPRARLNYAEKVLDTVGLNGRSQEALEEEILRKRSAARPGAQRRDAADDADGRWSASFASQLRDAADERSADELSAAARARKSKARLLDIQNELDGIGEREAARQKRSADLRALFADNEALTESVSSYSKKSSSSSSKKKVSF